jgi:hypothetical protein
MLHLRRARMPIPVIERRYPSADHPNHASHPRWSLGGAVPAMRDADIRQALRAYLRREHAEDGTTRIVEEMGVWSGSVRIDLAVINGELAGYELKSDRDTLERLPTQANIYSRVFDRVTIVAGSKHASKAFALVPSWWGQTVARSYQGRISLEVERPAKLSPGPDPELLARLLWKDEALAVLGHFGMARGLRSKKAREVYARLVSTFSLAELAHHVRAILKCRDGWLGQAIACQGDMPIQADGHPLFKVAGILGPSRDCIDGFVTPAAINPVAPPVPNDSLSVANKLGVLIDSVDAEGSNTTANKKISIKTILHVDRKPVGNPRRRSGNRNGRIVSEVKAIGQTNTHYLAPKSKLAASDQVDTSREASKVLGKGASSHGNRPPAPAGMKGSKGGKSGLAKGRNGVHVVGKIDDKVGIRRRVKPRRRPLCSG